MSREEGSRLRVLSLTCSYPTRQEGGRGSFVRARLLALAERTDLGIVAPVGWIRWGASGVWRFFGSHPEIVEDGGVRVRHPRWLYPPSRGWINGPLLFLQLLPLCRALRRRRPWDILEAAFGHPEGVAAALLTRVLGGRLAITLRGSELEHAGHRLRRRALGWALRRADLVIALSRELQELAVGLGVARSRTVRSLNGVDASLFRRGGRRAARRRLGLGSDLRIVLSAGHLIRLKGAHDLLQAMEGLFPAEPSLRLALAGDTGHHGASFARDLRLRARRSEHCGRIRFLGELSQRDLALWMSAADLFCLPSHREGCPNVVREALACGLPVVATRVGAVEDLVPSEDLGRVVPPGDPCALAAALRSALEAHWDREAIAAWGRSRDWGRVASELEDALAGCVARPPQGCRA